MKNGTNPEHRTLLVRPAESITPKVATWITAPKQWLQIVALGLTMALLALILGRSTPAAIEQRDQRIGAIVGAWSFDLLTWEFKAIAGKLAYALHPRPALTTDDEVALVRQYIEDANRLGSLENEITGLLSISSANLEGQIAQLQEQAAGLRAEQSERRPLVESIIQDQVATELLNAGFGVGNRPFPPVWFTFVEPPKKLVASPRHRIVTVYSRMLTEAINPVQAEASERAILEATDLSAYITNIGGLGAYPTMVVDRASLPWIFSTVVHEWTHNYLTLFPLGLRYNMSSELITINETVADIVGDEIGHQLVQRYYPEFLPPEKPVTPDSATGGEVLPVIYRPLPFNFEREMRETRQRVDALLASGFVDTAEYYLEARRRFFVAKGYPLRVLNQAYFAFHGSYGTSAASTSPIGPKLEALRAQSANLPAFLHTVRWFTSSEDLDRALSSYE